MRAPVQTADLFETIGELRATEPGLLSNFFASPGQVSSWMDRSANALSVVEGDRSILILRRDRGFQRLYHVAAGAHQLSAALASITADQHHVMVTDIVGTPEQVARIAEIHREHGFTDHTTLMRMACMTDGLPAGAEEPASHFAESEDVPAIRALFDQVLDPLRDQIPEAEEIEAAVARRSVLIDRRAGAAGGVLYFETTGLTSVLRYWYVDLNFHGQRIGGTLMRNYLGLCRCAGVARIVAWVVRDNADAIAKYRHYGFREDRLVDCILVSRGKS